MVRGMLIGVVSTLAIAAPAQAKLQTIQPDEKQTFKRHCFETVLVYDRRGRAISRLYYRNATRPQYWRGKGGIVHWDGTAIANHTRQPIRFEGVCP